MLQIGRKVLGSKRVQLTLLIALVVLSAGCMGLTDDGNGDGGADDGTDNGTDDGMDDGSDDGMDDGSDDGMDDGSDDGMDDGSSDDSSTDDGGMDDSDDGGSPAATGDSLSYVPNGINGIMYFDGAITTDQATEELADGLSEMGSEDVGPDGTESFEDQLDQIEAESDLSIDDFQSATVYFKNPNGVDTEDVGEEYAGVIVQSSWEWEQLLEAADDETEYEEDTYNGVAVYIDTTEGEEAWAADFGDGTFVFGTEAAVKDAIDTRQGDTDPFSGTVREAYDGAGDGLMKAAIDVSEEDFNEGSGLPAINVVTMSYATEGSEMQFGMDMTVETPKDARNFAGTLRFGLSSVTEDNPEAAKLLENLEIGSSGNRVTFDYTTTVDELLTQIEDLQNQGAGSGLSSTQQTAVAG